MGGCRVLYGQNTAKNSALKRDGLDRSFAKCIASEPDDPPAKGVVVWRCVDALRSGMSPSCVPTPGGSRIHSATRSLGERHCCVDEAGVATVTDTADVVTTGIPMPSNDPIEAL